LGLLFKRWKNRVYLEQRKELSSSKVIKFLRKRNLEVAWRRYKEGIEGEKREEDIERRIVSLR